jgi:glycosyltransferase involved in cell wall biosynthesis
VRRVAQVILNGEGTVGGEQRHVLNLIGGLDPDRYAVDVITWDVPPFVEELRAHGVPTHPVTARRVLDLALLRRIRTLLADGRYDLVHCHGHRAGLIGRVAARQARVPRLVWTCHLAENKADRNPVYRAGYAALLRWLDRRTDRTLVVSDELRRWLGTQGVPTADVLTVPNGVDAAVFHPGPCEPGVAEGLGLAADAGPDGVSPGAPVIGVVARLTLQKGVESFVDAAQLVAARLPGARFVVVGSGPLEGALRDRAARGSARIVFSGERTDVADILRCLDVVVVPSSWEGAFCYAMLEGMATRRPVVCSDIGQFADVVADSGAAVLFPAGDAEALAAAVIRLLGDPIAGDRGAEGGLALALERLSVEAMRRRIAGVYEELLGGETP